MAMALVLAATVAVAAAQDARADVVNTMFVSDVHIGEPNNTWARLASGMAYFRQSNPSASYLVYAGDTIMHNSVTEDGHADQYISSFIELARKQGFSLNNIVVAQGNNDGPHDQPLSPKWATAVAASGIVPVDAHSTLLSGSYYAKCLDNGLCAIVVNTDLEVYQSGDMAIDKARYKDRLSAAQLERVVRAKAEQKAWVVAKAKEFQSNGQPFFMVGHHPKLYDFFNVSGTFRGGIAGHLHVFLPTGFLASHLTVLPGYTISAYIRGFLQGSLRADSDIALRSPSHLVRYDAEHACFHPFGHSCSHSVTVLV
eukprot:TRINITY_DN14156_c0_g1_i1.p1 TRINITY_DN14156_c0_g1~~TRINITY_DN14156_c0_g1_i1.p1  ORF type:complete len:312 (+),score=44.83 TRINITY_DN14156_c0_g1_i1:74-1009(+)